jgi:hypothetical protein
MARASLVAVISRTRDLIGDAAGADQVFTDDQIAAALDERRQDVRYLELDPAETLAPGGVTYLDYYAPGGGPWEGVTLVNGSWTTLTASESDLASGHWAFTADTRPPVYITGHRFDLYGAAADLLETWAAQVSLDFDFSDAGASYHRSQKSAQLLAMAKQYRRRQPVKTIPQIRGDVWGT